MKYLVFIFLFSSSSLFSQIIKIDSLSLELKSHNKRDTIRVKILNRLAADLNRNNPEKSAKLINESLSISDSLHFQLGILESEYILGKIYTTKLQLNKADSVLHKSLKGYEKIKYKLGISKVYNQLGIVDYYRDDNESALSFFYKSLKENEKVNDLLLKANCYNNIGLIQNNRSNIDKAIEFYNKALLIYRDLGDKKKISLALNNIGIIYINKEEYDKAISAFKESLKVSKEINNIYLMGFLYHNLGVLFFQKKEKDLALSYYFKAVNYHKKIKNYSELCNSYNEIADLYISSKNNKLALKYIKKSENISNKYHLLKHQMKGFLLRSNFFKAKKKYNKSLEFYKKYKIYYDSIYSLESSNKIADLEVKYKHNQKELKLKEKEIELIKEVEEAKKALENNKKKVLYGLLITSVLFMMLGFVVYRARIKHLSVIYQKVNLEQKLLRSQMKPHFIFNSLSVLQGMFLYQDFDKANQYLSKFSRLLRKILETSREELISLKVELKIIEDYIALRNMSSTYPCCTYSIKIDESIDTSTLFIPPMIIQPIVENSFEHGFINLSKKYKLSITFKIEKDYLLCTIIDDGEGISMSTLKNKKSISSAIIQERLTSLSKNYTNEYHFKIKDRSNKGKQGTIVTLRLPYKMNKND